MEVVEKGRNDMEAVAKKSFKLFVLPAIVVIVLMTLYGMVK